MAPILGTSTSTLLEVVKKVGLWLADIAQTSLKSLGSALSNLFRCVGHWLGRIASSLLWWLWHDTGLQHACQIVLSILKISAIVLTLAITVPCVLLFTCSLIGYYFTLVRAVVHKIRRQRRARLSRDVRPSLGSQSASRLGYDTIATDQPSDVPRRTSSPPLGQDRRSRRPRNPAREQHTSETDRPQPRSTSPEHLARGNLAQLEDPPTPVSRSPNPPSYAPTPVQVWAAEPNLPPTYTTSENIPPPPYVASFYDA
jgi:hypothetical protein